MIIKMIKIELDLVGKIQMVVSRIVLLIYLHFI